jgi:DNA-binding XRE family transcriptional regulator
VTVKILEAKGKPAFVVVPYDEYQALRAAAEDASDSVALARFARRHGKRLEETVPAAVLDRMLAGEPALRVWRQHRSMSAAALAAAVGVTRAHVSKLENGKGDPSISLLRKLAKVLNVDLELLAGPAEE